LDEKQAITTNYTGYLKKGAKMTLGLAHAIARGDVVLKNDK